LGYDLVGAVQLEPAEVAITKGAVSLELLEDPCGLWLLRWA